MTKAEAQQIARQAGRYGHYGDRDHSQDVYLSCPRCRQRVPAMRELRQATRGPLQ